MLVQDKVAGTPRKWHKEVAWPLHENEEPSFGMQCLFAGYNMVCSVPDK